MDESVDEKVRGERRRTRQRTGKDAKPWPKFSSVSQIRSVTVRSFLPKQNSAFGLSFVASLTWKRENPSLSSSTSHDHEPGPSTGSGRHRTALLPTVQQNRPFKSHLGDVGELEGADTISTDGQVLREEEQKASFTSGPIRPCKLPRKVSISGSTGAHQRGHLNIFNEREDPELLSVVISSEPELGPLCWI